MRPNILHSTVKADAARQHVRASSRTRTVVSVLAERNVWSSSGSWSGFTNTFALRSRRRDAASGADFELTYRLVPDRALGLREIGPIFQTVQLGDNPPSLALAGPSQELVLGSVEDFHLSGMSGNDDPAWVNSELSKWDDRDQRDVLRHCSESRKADHGRDECGSNDDDDGVEQLLLGGVISGHGFGEVDA